ncbi:MAG: hypothetical protein GXP27_07255 [Planctomycetes bacterium]|nr:hypothetical protein [Planctomycetota bacterium]
MSDIDIHLSMSLSGPRWARLDWAVRDAASSLGLECNVSREASWLTERVEFTVVGSRRKADAFRAWLEGAIREWS